MTPTPSEASPPRTSPLRTSLPPVDEAAVATYWARCVEDLDLDPETPYPVAEYFGDSMEMADELADLVVHGPKRATAGAWIEYEHTGEPLPRPDGYWIALRGDGRPAGLLQTTWVRVGPLTSVDDQFALDEGEGDRTRDWWIEAHREFYRRFLPTVPLPYDDDLDLVFERFALVHTPEDGPVPEPRRTDGLEPA